jgi:hypothetical protein
VSKSLIFHIPKIPLSYIISNLRNALPWVSPTLGSLQPLGLSNPSVQGLRGRWSDTLSESVSERNRLQLSTQTAALSVDVVTIN